MWHGLLQNAVDYNERKFLAPVDHLLTFMLLQICDFLFSVEIVTIFFFLFLMNQFTKLVCSKNHVQKQLTELI